MKFVQFDMPDSKSFQPIDNMLKKEKKKTNLSLFDSYDGKEIIKP